MSLTTQVWNMTATISSYWKPREDQKIIAFKLFAHHSCNLKTILMIGRLCTDLNVYCSEILEEIRETFYLRSTENYSPYQLQFLNNNISMLGGHSAVYISLCTHNMISRYPESNKKIIPCSVLKCIPSCHHKLDEYDKLLLLDKRVVIKSSRVVIEISSFSDMKYFMPWIITQADLSLKREARLGINIFDFPCFNFIHRSECLIEFFYLIQEFDSDSNSTSRLLYEKIKLMGRSEVGDQKGHPLDPNVSVSPLGRSVLMEMIKCIGPIDNIYSFFLTERLENSDPSTDLELLVNTLHTFTPCLILPERPSSVRLVTFPKPHTRTIQGLLIKHRDEYNNIVPSHLFIDQTSLYAYTITNCLKFLRKATNTIIAVPKVIVTRLDQTLYILPENTMETVPNLFEFFRGVREMATFTVISYLLGFSHGWVMVCHQGIFSLDYTNLYESEKVFIGNFCNDMGGRSSEAYSQYLHECTKQYLMFRKYYKHVMMFMDALSVRRNLVEARFNPRLDDNTATRHFISLIRKMAKKSMGFWTYFGY